MELVPNPWSTPDGQEMNLTKESLKASAGEEGKTELDQERWKEGGIHEIEVSVTVQQFGQIDMVAECFVARLWVDVWWLPSEKEAETGEATEWDIEEGFQLVGSLEAEQEIKGGPTIKDVGGREMFHATLAIKGTFSMLLDLRAFPFDVQVLTIVTEMGNFKNVQYLPPRHMDKCCTMDDNLAEYAMENYAMSFTASDAALSKRGNRYAQLQISFVLRREWQPYFFRIIAQVSAMCCASVAVYAIPAEDVADRLGYLYTIILTLVAFQMTIASTIPPTPYLTWLDKYIGSTSFLLFGAVFATTILGWQGSKEHEELDHYCFIGVSSTTLAMQLFWLIHAIWTRRDSVRASLDLKGSKTRQNEVYSMGNASQSRNFAIKHEKDKYMNADMRGSCFTCKNW